MSDPATKKPSRTASLAIVYGTVFLDLLGFGIILPSLPFWARDLGASGLGLGILLSSYSLAQLVGSPIFGRLSDRHGRRPILLLALSGSAVAMVLSGLAPGLVLLCAARALAGFFGGSIATAQAYIADSTEIHERAKFMGLLGASIGLGFVFGPALGALVVALGYGFSMAAYVAAALATLNLVFAWFRLQESPREPGVPRASMVTTWKRAWTVTGLRQLLLANFLITVTFVTMEATFAYLGEDLFDLDEIGFGMIMFSIGLLLVLVQGGLIGRLSKRFGTPALALVGAGMMAIAMLFVPQSTTLWIAVIPLAVLSVGRGLVSPSLSTLVSKLSDLESQGAVLGILHSMAAAARAFTPVIAGWLYDAGQVYPYLLGAAASAGAVAMVVVAWRSLVAPETEVA